MIRVIDFDFSLFDFCEIDLSLSFYFFSVAQDCELILLKDFLWTLVFDLLEPWVFIFLVEDYFFNCFNEIIHYKSSFNDILLEYRLWDNGSLIDEEIDFFFGIWRFLTINDTLLEAAWDWFLVLCKLLFT